MSRSKFTTVSAAKRLMSSMEVAINNMIEEVKKPVDPELSGAGRKAELSSIKQTAVDCKELLVERLEHLKGTVAAAAATKRTSTYGIDAQLTAV